MKRTLFAACALLILHPAGMFAACDQNPAASTFSPQNRCSYAKPCLEDQPNTITLSVDTDCYPRWKPCQAFTFNSCDVVEWDFGDGTTATVVGSASVSHVWKDPGAYPIQIRVRNAKGEKTLSGTFTVVRRPPAFVEWSDDLYTASETDGIVTLQLVRTGDLTRNVTVLCGVLGGMSGEPWVSNLENIWDRPVTIPAGAGSATVTLRVRNDDVYRGEQRYDVFVHEDTGEAVLPNGGQIANAQIRIFEDEPGPTLEVADMRVSEGDSGSRFVQIPHVLSQPLAEDLMLWWEIGVGTATLNDDWKTNSGGPYFVEQHIRAGQTTTNLQVAIVGDRNAEADETVVIRLAKPVGPAVGLSQSEVVVTIVDDDLYRLTADERRVDSGSKVSLTLATSKPSPVPVTLSIDASDRTVIAVPPSITLAANATETRFEAETLRPGVVTVRAKLPDGRSISTEVISELRTTLRFTSDGARVAAGERIYVTLATDPPVSTLATIDPTPASVIDAPASATIGVEGTATIAVDGRQIGTGLVTAALPEEYGRSTARIVVNVVPELTPRLTSITPPYGSVAGGTRVTISGVDFSASCGVLFDGVIASSTMTDERTLMATTPPHAPGWTEVLLQCGEKTVSLPAGYRYVQAKRRAAR